MSSPLLTRNWIVFIVILLGWVLRFYNYAHFPIPHETADEMAWTMVGTSLLQAGVPTGWSYFEYPSRQEVVINDQFYPLVTPYLDHPPLFSLVPGSIQWLKKASVTEPLGFEWLRFPVVLIGCLNLVLFYFVSKSLFATKSEHLVSTALFALTPSIIFSSRLVLAENVLITWLLLLILLITKLEQYRRIFPVAVILVTCLMILTKVAGIALVAGIGLYALLYKNYRLLWLLIIGAVTGFVTTLAYASYYNLDLFFSIQSQQSSYRHQDLISPLISLFIQPELVNSLYFDGFIALGCIALVLIALWDRSQRQTLVLSVSVMYILFIVVAVGALIGAPDSFLGSALYGWYLYPLYPLFVLAIADMLEELRRRPRPFFLFFLILIGLFPLIRVVQFISTNSIATMTMPKHLVWFVAFCAGLALVTPDKLWQPSVKVWFLFYLIISSILVMAITPEAYIHYGRYLESL